MSDGYDELGADTAAPACARMYPTTPAVPATNRPAPVPLPAKTPAGAIVPPRAVEQTGRI